MKTNAPKHSPGARLLAKVIGGIFGIVLVVYGLNCLLTRRASLPTYGGLPKGWLSHSLPYYVTGADALALGVGYVALGGLLSGIALYASHSRRPARHHAWWRAAGVFAFLLFIACLVFVILRYFAGQVVFRY
jgi:hypothetical protein